MTLTLTHFLVLSAILVGAGVMTMALRRTAVGILMGAELIISAAALNFVAFNAFLPTTSSASPGSPRLDGQLFALFIILLAALQAVMVVAIMVNLRNVDAEKVQPANRDAAKS